MSVNFSIYPDQNKPLIICQDNKPFILSTENGNRLTHKVRQLVNLWIKNIKIPIDQSIILHVDKNGYTTNVSYSLPETYAFKILEQTVLIDERSRNDYHALLNCLKSECNPKTIQELIERSHLSTQDKQAIELAITGENNPIPALGVALYTSILRQFIANTPLENFLRDEEIKAFGRDFFVLKVQNNKESRFYNLDNIGEYLQRHLELNASMTDRCFHMLLFRQLQNDNPSQNVDKTYLLSIKPLLQNTRQSIKNLPLPPRRKEKHAIA